MLFRLFAALCTVACAFAIFVGPSTAPIERIVANNTAFVKAHPENAEGFYALARTHYLAFALGGPTLQYQPGRTDPPTPWEPFNSFATGRVSDWARANSKQQMTPAAREKHYEEALKHFRRALELKPNDALYTLGLASLHEDHKEFEAAAKEYLAAFDATIGTDEKSTHMPLMGLGMLVSYEAGRSYVRLIKERGPKPEEAANLARVDAAVAKLQKLPVGAITPVIFSLNANASRIDDLLAPGVEANVDLDGTGRAQRYPWLKPDTAILVWDPERSGRITSGRQLFGTVSWWIFWENGYRALDALDDNRDGRLSGAELDGLALWFDRNQNGRSDPGEVTPIERTEIESILVTYDDRDGESLVSRSGLKLKDGRTLPTWDWIVNRVEPPVIGLNRRP